MQSQSSIPTFGDERLPPRFWQKVRVTQSGCWEWVGSRTLDGYGQTMIGSRRDGSRCHVLIHRWVYENLIGPFPPDLESDHLCRNRVCANPVHIEPVTSRENVLRGNGHTAINARKTHCIHGHAFDEGNTWRLDGRRHCRTCDRQRRAAARQRRTR